MTLEGPYPPSVMPAEQTQVLSKLEGGAWAVVENYEGKWVLSDDLHDMPIVEWYELPVSP